MAKARFLLRSQICCKFARVLAAHLTPAPLCVFYAKNVDSGEEIWHLCANVRNGSCPPVEAMKRCRMRVFYSGSVQGVGFRYTTRSAAAGFEVTGTVRNLPDGRVELVAEGASDELEAFRRAIRESGLEHFIRNEDISWSEATDEFCGFEIVR